MGISNIASNLRPGICTSTTRPTTPYEGQVIYETDTNRTLVWDNAAWVDPSTGKTQRAGLVKMVPTGATNGTVAANGDVTADATVSSLTITGCFTSDFDNYSIQLVGGSNSVSNADLQLQLRTSGGTTSTTGYYHALLYSNYTSSLVFNNNNGTTWGNAGACISTTTPLMDVTLLGPNLARRTGFSSRFIRGDAVGTAQGAHDIATAYNSIVITAGSGTISSCVVRIYGYN